MNEIDFTAGIFHSASVEVTQSVREVVRALIHPGHARGSMKTVRGSVHRARVAIEPVEDFLHQ